jgi:hypothetical protein
MSRFLSGPIENDGITYRQVFGHPNLDHVTASR